MKIAVTGASGFIGRRLVKSLCQEGHAVTVLSRRSPGGFSAGVQVVAGDLTSPTCPLNRFLADAEILYHCAGEVRNPKEMRKLHVDGTERLGAAALRIARERGRPLHWVQLSSVGVYGPPAGPAGMARIVVETSPVRPRGEYEITKAQADEMVLRSSEGRFLTHAIVRPSNVFGRDMTNNSLRSLGAMVRRGRFFYIGPPGVISTYIHVDDVVEVLRICGMDARARGRTFNVSNDCPLEELLGAIARVLRVRPPRWRLPEVPTRALAGLLARIRPIPLTASRIDALVARTRYPATELEQAVGFRPQIPVPDGIRELFTA